MLSLVISGTSSLDRKSYKNLGFYAILYYATTNIMAVLTGILLVVFIQPGKSPKHTSASSGGQVDVLQTFDAFLDLIRWELKSTVRHHLCSPG